MNKFKLHLLATKTLLFLSFALSIAVKDIGITASYASDSTASIVYYVNANGGNNYNNGITKETAFRTIEKARDKIREHGFKGVIVNIMEGVYRLSDTIEFDERDSGENGKPNIYQAYQGDNVIISGGIEIGNTGWNPYQHNGKTIYRKNVGSLRFNSLFVNDKRAIRAREPDLTDETPYYLIKETDEESLTSFYFYEGDIDPNWKNLRNIEVYSYIMWIAPRMRIDRVEGDKVYIQGSLKEGEGYDREYYGYQKRYFVENVFEGLDSPGEWYLDINGDLYYYPLPGEDINSAEIIVPVLDQLITLTDAEYITFKNLTFAYTDWSLAETGWNGLAGAVGIYYLPAIRFNRTEHCSFENNIVKHIGNSAIGAYWYFNEYLNIIGNEVYDIGTMGIALVNYEEPGVNSVRTPCIISDNIIHDIGVVNREGVGIRTNGMNMTISHNTVYNVSLDGIVLMTIKQREDLGENWQDEWIINTIEYNEVYNVMKELNDGGGIYVTGHQPGSLIQYNYVHDILGTKFHVRKGEGTIQGIYVDEGGKGFIIKNNLVVRTDNALQLYRSHNNEVTNNIFIDSDYRDIVFSRLSSDPRDSGLPGNLFTKNIIYNTDENSNLFHVNEEEGQINVEYSDYNLFYTTEPENPNWNLNWWKARYGFDSNSFVSDPLFKDYFNGNFNLQNDSPAFDLGFVNFDLSTVGPR
jgi:parallel beta-helix repeat protein